MKKEQYKKVQNKITKDVYYTSNMMPIKEIDGIAFIQVKRNINDKTIFLVKKDSLENVK